MLSISQTYACYRFLVDSYPSKSYSIQITLINWDSFLESSFLLPSGSSSARMMPVLKVFYRISINPHFVAVEHMQRDILGWCEKHCARTITFSEDECKELINVLQSSTQILPPSAQTIFGQKIGFLTLNYTN